jgi:cytochrome b involved in lipid metabolism
MNIKKEFIFGIGTIILICIVIIFSAINFKNQKVTFQKASPSAVNLNTVLAMQEIAKHNNKADCWLLIQNKVYDVTTYLSKHPGGALIITPFCGKDATQAYLTKAGKGSHSSNANKQLGMVYIGDLNGKIKQKVNNNVIKNLNSGKNEEEDQNEE